MRSWSSLMMAWLSDRVRLRDCTRSFWLDSSSSVFCRLVDKRSMVSWRDWDLDSRPWICLFRASMRSCKTCLWNYRKKSFLKKFPQITKKTYYLKKVPQYPYFHNMNFNVRAKISTLHMKTRKTEPKETKISIWQQYFSQNNLTTQSIEKVCISQAFHQNHDLDVPHFNTIGITSPRVFCHENHPKPVLL